MIIITSPAKRLEEKGEFVFKKTTKPRFLEDSATIVGILKKKSSSQLEKLFGVSSKIAKLNEERFNSWDKNHTLKNSRPAIQMFKGDVYRELDLGEYNSSQLNNLNNSLRIISGLYGLLRPSDLIQPYRLEMGTKLKVENKENLYEFWNEKTTKQLNLDIKSTKSKYLINLASREYSKAISFQNLNAEVIDIEFRQKRDGKLKNIGIIAKKSRGKMIDYIVKNSVQTLNDLKNFDLDGYKFKSQQSNKLFFVK